MTFPVYDSMKASNKPSSASLGLTFMKVIYEASIVPDPNNPPNQAAVTASLAPWVNEPIICVDVESWWVNTNQSTRLASAAKYVDLFSKMRIGAPNSLLGFYGTVPIRDYFNAIDGDGTPTYDAWQATNDDWASVAAVVDILFPSVYFFYPKVAENKRYAKAQIDECRRLAPTKLCYPFLMPQYHTSNAAMGDQYCSYNYFYDQLHTLRQYADGVVLWTPDQVDWNVASPLEWWTATQRFLTHTEAQIAIKG